MNKKFACIGIVGHPRHPSALATHEMLFHWLVARCYSVMVERQIADGSLVVLATDPPVGDGRVYVAYREGGESRAIDAIIHCLRGVLSSMDYLVTA